jgi:hypothetical protein
MLSNVETITGYHRITMPESDVRISVVLVGNDIYLSKVPTFHAELVDLSWVEQCFNRPFFFSRPPFSMLSFTCLLPLLLLFPSTFAVLVNVTIDDSLGDPTTGAQITYEPLNSWKLGGACTGCPVSPNGDSAYQRTWHEGTFVRPTAPEAILQSTNLFTAEQVPSTRRAPQHTTTGDCPLLW